MIVAAILFYVTLTHITAINAALGKMMTILSPFVWGLVIAYLMCPLMNVYQRKLFTPIGERLFARSTNAQKKIFKFSRAFSVFLAMISLLVIIAAVIWLIAPRLVDSVRTIVLNGRDYINAAYGWIDRLLSDYPEIETAITETYGDISENLLTWLSGMLPRLEGLITNVTSGAYYFLKEIYNILIGMIASVYVLYNKENVSIHAKKLIYCIFSVEAAEKLIKAFRFIDDVFIGFLIGKIVDSAIIGAICYVVCSLLNMPYTLLVSVIVGITNIIPFFGPFIGAIPSTLIILLEDPMHGLIFVIFVFLLQQFDGNFLGPKILGNSVGINGFWVMFSIIIGAGLFGFIGMLLGVPAFVIIYTGIQFLIDRKLKRSNLSTEDEYYRDISYIDPETGLGVRKELPEEKSQRRKASGKKKKNINKHVFAHILHSDKKPASGNDTAESKGGKEGENKE